MNTKYSNWKMWYYVLCMILTLQLAACSEETHDEYTAAPEIEDTYIDQLDALIAEMTDLQQNSDYGDKKGQYPTESRAILTDAIDDANRAVLLIKYQQPSPSESEKQRYVAEAKASIEQFKSTIRTEDAETTPIRESTNESISEETCCCRSCRKSTNESISEQITRFIRGR